MARRSTTKKISRADVRTITEIINSTPNNVGVIVRRRGVDYGVIGVVDFSGVPHFETYEGESLDYRSCTILRSSVLQYKYEILFAGDAVDSAVEKSTFSGGSVWNPVARYVVSVRGVKIPLDSVNRITVGHWLRYYLYSLPYRDGVNNVGWWADAETNLFYVDQNCEIDSLADAIRIGKQSKQLAIWDHVEGKEIRLTYDD